MSTAATEGAGPLADIGIVDAHHHLWRRADLPWLAGPPVPRIFGPYESIRRDYLAEEYIAEATASGVVASVYVQTNWPLDRSVDEVRWVQSVHEQHGWPQAIVGSADMFDPDAALVWAQQRDLTPLMRGTRLQLHWHERPELRFASAPDRMQDPVFRDNLARLADLGWVFELQVFAPQMADAAGLVADFPDVTFVLVHAGMLESLEERHVGPWSTGMRALAEQPNVVVKLSGQGTFPHRVDHDLIGFVAGRCLGWFGSDRCMFGSNFPVEKIWTEFGPLVAAWRGAVAAVADSPEAEMDVFSRTARRVYRI